MAGGQTKHVWNGTLQPSAVDVVGLTDAHNVVTITNVTNQAPIYFTVSEPGGACPTPTVGGTGCYCAASVAGANVVNVRHDGMFGGIISLIAASVTAYSVSINS